MVLTPKASPTWNGANYAGEGMYAPDDDGGRLMFPTLV